MLERVLKVFIDNAVASAPVSNLNITSWPFTRIGAVHEMPFVSFIVSRKPLSSCGSSEWVATALLQQTSYICDTQLPLLGRIVLGEVLFHSRST